MGVAPIGQFIANKGRQNKPSNSQIWIKILSGGGISIGLSGGVLCYNDLGIKEAGERIDGLTEYTAEEVRNHDNISNRVWVTYHEGVYDVTDFIPLHPGAEKLLLAAGGSIEPFWDILAVHKENQTVHDRLESYRIGNLKGGNVGQSESDPYISEPTRDRRLVTKNQTPFVGETPLDILCGDFITPTELFFVRNHLPVPEINLSEYSLGISGVGVDTKQFSIEDIKKLPVHTLTATLQGAANRRDELCEVLPLPFIKFGGGCTGTAVWTGVKLRDVLKVAGFDEMSNSRGAQHVVFEGLDMGPGGSHYSASIPIQKAVDQYGDVILAYEMNGEPLTPDHGFPLRALVPGVVGARSVKWLGRVEVSAQECGSHWQQLDYKGQNPSVMWGHQQFDKAEAIQGMPVTSMICNTSLVDSKTRRVSVSGYAWSGSGRRILRVDLTGDGGKTWTEATGLVQRDDTQPQHWGWTLWEGSVLVETKVEGEAEVWSKAVDSDYNVQPESTRHIWNLRGLLNNAYSKAKL